MKNENIVELRNLSKRFGKIIALRNVDFNVNYNEIVGLVGDNGAGKSTLVKIIAGVYAPDEGVIIIKGKEYKKLTPQKAYELGITLIHQERTLCSSHSVWRNIFLGREITNKLGFLDINRMKYTASKCITQLGLGAIDVDRSVATLSGGYQQGVQISRALVFNADLIIFDEPTNALSIAETKRVLDYIMELKNKGKSVILISHNIYHVYPVAERFVLMDRGRIVAEFYKKDLTLDDLTNIMISLASTGSIPKEYEKYNLLK